MLALCNCFSFNWSCYALLKQLIPRCAISCKGLLQTEFCLTRFDQTVSEHPLCFFSITDAVGEVFIIILLSSFGMGDRVEDDPLTQSIDSEGAQTQFFRTPSSGVTGPPETASVLELSSRQRVGAEASEH
jgi:hypothetical protein